MIAKAAGDRDSDAIISDGAVAHFSLSLSGPEAVAAR
jgi:hypothetical protein